MVGAMAMAVAWLQRKCSPTGPPPPRADPSPRPLPAYRPRGLGNLERFLAQLMAQLDDVMAQLTLTRCSAARTRTTSTTSSPPFRTRVT